MRTLLCSFLAVFVVSAIYTHNYLALGMFVLGFIGILKAIFLGK